MSDDTAPRNARGRRTREALLAAARALVEDQGFTGLTMSAVAERAGITRRAVYLHFASRRELVLSLYDHVVAVDGRDASLRKVFSAPDAVAALDEWAAHLARFHPRVMALDTWVRAAARTDPDVAAYRDLTVARQREGCGVLIDNLATEGRLSPDWTVDTAADMLWALLSTDVVYGLLIERHWTETALRNHLALLFRSTFVTDDEVVAAQDHRAPGAPK